MLIPTPLITAVFKHSQFKCLGRVCRRKLEELNHAALDVSHGIDAFEINMKRLVKGDADGDEALAPATTRSPLEHQNMMKGMATATSKLLEESQVCIAIEKCVMPQTYKTECKTKKPNFKFPYLYSMVWSSTHQMYCREYHAYGHIQAILAKPQITT